MIASWYKKAIRRIWDLLARAGFDLGKAHTAVRFDLATNAKQAALRAIRLQGFLMAQNDRRVRMDPVWLGFTTTFVKPIIGSVEA